jgi:Mg2+-importing ATPase
MANIPLAVLPKSALPSKRHIASAIRVSPVVAESAALDVPGVYAKLNTRPEGLTDDEAAARLAQYGPNVLAKDQRPGFGKLLWRALINPLVILLAVLATTSFAAGDFGSGVIMVSMKGTYLGGMAQSIQEQTTQTSFDRQQCLADGSATH